MIRLGMSTRHEIQNGGRQSMYALRKSGMPSLRPWPPVEGYYEVKVQDRWIALHIYFAPSADPETGEPLDRSPYWHCDVNGTEGDITDWWPECSGRVITRTQYLQMLEMEMEDGSK